MIRAYQIFGVLLLSVLALANYRGWSPGTEESEEQAAASDQSSSHARGSSIRNRTYRGGK
jgi:hypothetical protein